MFRPSISAFMPLAAPYSASRMPSAAPRLRPPTSAATLCACSLTIAAASGGNSPLSVPICCSICSGSNARAQMEISARDRREQGEQAVERHSRRDQRDMVVAQFASRSGAGCPAIRTWGSAPDDRPGGPALPAPRRSLIRSRRAANSLRPRPGWSGAVPVAHRAPIPGCAQASLLPTWPGFCRSASAWAASVAASATRLAL